MGYARHATAGSSKGLYGISPSYQDYHRKNSHFVHNWGDGVFYYYYLSGDERARELALRGARTMASRGDLDGTGRGGQQKNSWALGGYKLTHDAALIPRELLPHWKRRFAQLERSERMQRWLRRKVGPRPGKLLRHVLDRIREEGPLMSRDFEHTRRAPSSGWWDWKPCRRAWGIRPRAKSA